MRNEEAGTLELVSRNKIGSKPSTSLSYYSNQRGQRLEGWYHTAARQAELEESYPAEGCDFVRDGRSMPSALTDHSTCPGVGLIYMYF